MNRILTLGCLLVSLSACLVAADRPNVVVILTDNHGAWTLGCYGNPDIRTPNIDRLAAEGTLFTRAFASNPVCSPTRATLLTGLVPSQHGVHSFLTGGGLQTGPDARCTLAEFTSLPEVLQRNGYACGLVGKWHLGGNLTPQAGLDDYWVTMPHGATSTFYDAEVIEDGEIRSEPKYLTDFWTEHAVKFIRDQAEEKDQPFFLLLAYNGPYALSRWLLREGSNRHAAYYADQELASFPRVTPHPWQFNNRDFINQPSAIRRVATEISGVDDGVGEVMRTLRELGLDDNTVVVFLADQGWVGGQGGFFGMGDHTQPLTARDGMLQIPLIWRQPGKISAARNDQLIANYDVMPTLLGHLGLADQMPDTPPSPGSDLSPLLVGKPRSAKHAADAVFFEFENLRGIRTETHKYVHRHPNGPHELYDLRDDPDEFVNLVEDPRQAELRRDLKSHLDAFYAEHSLQKYDLWRGGTSQVQLHEGIDEEVIQLTSVSPPPLPDGFQPAPIEVPEGYSVELVAGPPLVTHPTLGCFDDQGNLYICNNAGLNLSNVELEQQLPNSIRRLVDSDQDGQFDSFTVFADQMTFPMGGAWHDGSLYVASPPSIWKLTDTDNDGVADQRQVIVSKFGYTGNAASIHGCFVGPEGRIYWTDGYHGHEFKDAQGNITSKREGSYLFSCLPDGADTRIHCGGGMDNPVEIDFTDAGDMLGTVNILYTRPRVDCLVHWLHGGAYPHREKVLDEIKITGDLLEPAHRFGHVAISGLTRYRSGVMDHRFGDHWFATFFNSGKVVRLELSASGSTYQVDQFEFLSSPSREFHPTDVIEDADGSLLVVDTGGWFYSGCPTSQFAKPDLLGGIYRVKRTGMTTLVDPRGLQVDWKSASVPALIKLFNDTRHAVRQRAVDECVQRGAAGLPDLKPVVQRGDIRVRQNAVLTLSRLSQQPATAEAATAALQLALTDPLPQIRQSACRGLAFSVASFDPAPITAILRDDSAGVRRQAATTLGMRGDSSCVAELVHALGHEHLDHPAEHAIVYALIEIGDAEAVREAMSQFIGQLNTVSVRGVLMALDQIDGSSVKFSELQMALHSDDLATLRAVARIAKKHPEWADQIAEVLQNVLSQQSVEHETALVSSLLTSFANLPAVAEVVGKVLADDQFAPQSKQLVTKSLVSAGRIEPHASWIEPLRKQLVGSDDKRLAEAIAVAAAVGGFAAELRAIADDPQRTMTLRMSALAAITLHSGKLDDATLKQLIELYQRSASPEASGRAAQIIGSGQLANEQLSQVVPLLKNASPAELRDLINTFQRKLNQQQAVEFLDGLEASAAWTSLAEHELSEVIKGFPAETLERANQMLDQLKGRHQEKLKRLEQLRTQLAQGDAQRGQKVFASEKAKCAACHRIGQSGVAVGPDLTTIGANRSANDLLESIVFPSASIVRDYEPRKVLTADGRALTGLVVKESASELQLQLANGERVQLQQSDIEQITPSTVSIMPAGLEEALTEQELLDVVSYLQGLRSAP